MSDELTPEQTLALNNVAASFERESMGIDDHERGILTDFILGSMDGEECECPLNEYSSDSPDFSVTEVVTP